MNDDKRVSKVGRLGNKGGGTGDGGDSGGGGDGSRGTTIRIKTIESAWQQVQGWVHIDYIGRCRGGRGLVIAFLTKSTSTHKRIAGAEPQKHRTETNSHQYELS